MKLLLLKLSLFFIICQGIVTVVLVNYGGNVDYFYEKFTTPKTKSMIIGDSRSLQGIQPGVINTYFKDKKYELPILNYSFTIAQALMGPLYNESIFKKLDTTSNKGLFIISVTPDMLTSYEGYNNEKGEFREFGQPPHNMNFVNVNPNYEYLIKNFSFFHFKGVFRKSSTLHKDGWLEETNLPSNKQVFENWKKSQIALYLKDQERLELSNVRLNSLVTLVRKLDRYGDVYLLRMPISKEYLGYEEKYYPNFDRTIDSISKKYQTPYFNFNTMDMIYETYDGHHIDKFAGKEFTKNLCKLILMNNKN